MSDGPASWKVVPREGDNAVLSELVELDRLDNPGARWSASDSIRVSIYERLARRKAGAGCPCGGCTDGE